MHPYEDRDLVREMLIHEVMEEEMETTPFIPQGFEGLMATLAAQVQATKPQPKRRVTILSGARKQLEGGVLPDPVEIKSEANLSYNNHMAKLYDFAKAGLRNAVEDYPLAGTNTYAKAVKGYRDLLLEYLDSKIVVSKPAVSKVATAQPKAPAKKISALPAKAKAPADKSSKTPAKSATTSAKARKAPAKNK